VAWQEIGISPGLLRTAVDELAAAGQLHVVGDGELLVAVATTTSAMPGGKASP
jgi:hypothetical protein